MEIFKFLIVILLKSQTFSLAVSDFNTETVDAKLDQIYQRQANSTLEFIFHYRDLEGLFTIFFKISCLFSTYDVEKLRRFWLNRKNLICVTLI